MTAKGVAVVLHEIYVRYFPIEVNPHYREVRLSSLVCGFDSQRVDLSSLSAIFGADFCNESYY